MPIADSQGTTFTFGGVEFVAKNVKVKRAHPVVDVTSLSHTGTREYQESPLADGDVITLEYFGAEGPAMGSKQTIACANLGVSGDAFCEEFEITAQVGELLSGTATFRVSA